MSRFLHEVVAKRGVYPPVVRHDAQYSNIYRDIYIESHYTYLVYVSGSFVIPTIRAWRDHPSYDTLTAIFHGVSCQHRWLFLLPECTLETWYYRCIDCQDTRTSRGNQDVRTTT
jgi:hypothetical protein